MIKELIQEDINEIMKIWQESTIEAHKFISQDYWLKNYSLVKETYIPLAKTFVYKENDTNKGFISILNGEFIGALFIDVRYQGKGIGTKLIEFAKKNYEKLSLAVYEKNRKAVEFYEHLGFVIDKEEINEETKEKEFIMIWSK